MTRHSRNNTDGAVFTYHEKRAAGFGSEKVRLGSDSVRNFDCCCLSLQPCRDPMVSPDGYLFDKEYIFENLLKQKQAIKARTLEWEKQEEQRAATARREEDARRERERSSFALLETGSSTDVAPKESNVTISTTRVMSHGVDVTKALQNNFWLPTNTPIAETTVIEKPDTSTRNPISNRPLRVKDLTPVKFTSIREKGGGGKSVADDNRYGRYMCPVCSKSLTNSVKSAVLRPTGAVVCNECVKRFVQKDNKDPLTGKKLNVKTDVLSLQSGGTAFAASTGGAKEAKRYKPALRS